jgi:hypothetical protein
MLKVFSKIAGLRESGAPDRFYLTKINERKERKEPVRRTPLEETLKF